MFIAIHAIDYDIFSCLKNTTIYFLKYEIFRRPFKIWKILFQIINIHSWCIDATNGDKWYFDCSIDLVVYCWKSNKFSYYFKEKALCISKWNILHFHGLIWYYQIFWSLQHVSWTQYFNNKVENFLTTLFINITFSVRSILVDTDNTYLTYNQVTDTNIVFPGDGSYVYFLYFILPFHSPAISVGSFTIFIFWFASFFIFTTTTINYKLTNCMVFIILLFPYHLLYYGLLIKIWNLFELII